MPNTEKHMPEVEKEAKSAALEWLNANRLSDGLPPMKRIEKLWWTIHGSEWIGAQQRKARAALNEKE